MEWLISGVVTFRGVEITVEAESETEAIEKAEAGHWLIYDLACAELCDWEIRKRNATPA